MQNTAARYLSYVSDCVTQDAERLGYVDKTWVAPEVDPRKLILSPEFTRYTTDGILLKLLPQRPQDGNAPIRSYLLHNVKLRAWRFKEPCLGGDRCPLCAWMQRTDVALRDNGKRYFVAIAAVVRDPHERYAPFALTALEYGATINSLIEDQFRMGRDPFDPASPLLLRLRVAWTGNGTTPTYKASAFETADAYLDGTGVSKLLTLRDAFSLVDYPQRDSVMIQRSFAKLAPEQSAFVRRQLKGLSPAQDASSVS